VDELESKVIFKSSLERIPRHNKNDKKAREMAIRKAFHLGPTYVGDPGLPIPHQRTKQRKSKTKGKTSYYLDVPTFYS
jgi:hypothetical protein